MPYVTCPLCKKTWKWDETRRRGTIWMELDHSDRFWEIWAEMRKKPLNPTGRDDRIALQMIEEGNMMTIVCPECHASQKCPPSMRMLERVKPGEELS